MIETHPAPDQALSDGYQQLDLRDLPKLGRAWPPRGQVAAPRERSLRASFFSKSRAAEFMQ